jgi:branched-chain amino acid aminotransferase
VSGSLVWVNGAWEGRVDAFDRGLLLGDGVFDTLVAFDRVPFLGKRHLDRLVGHAAEIGIAIDPAAVRTAWSAVLGRSPGRHAILRTTVTRGRAERGLWPRKPGPPTVIVSAAPWTPALVGRPVRLATASIRRNRSSPTSRLKTLGYLDNILAARDATAVGADDALLLNDLERPACSTIANLFIINGGELATPPVSDGILPGTVRALVLENASAVGLRAEERSLSVSETLGADAVFLTNSVRFAAPVASLDGVALHERSDRWSALLAAVARIAKEECAFDPRDSA